MDIPKLNIPDGVYGRKLHSEIWKLQYDEAYDLKLINLLLAILKIDLLKINDECLKKSFKNHLDELSNIDILSFTTNKELIARSLEIRVLLNRKNIRPYLQVASDSYWDVYLAKGDYEYLIRHIGLIRLAKSLFENNIESIFQKIKVIVLELPYPYWQFQVIKVMGFTFSPKACQDAFENMLADRIGKLTASRDYTGARLCLDSLAAIASISKNACRIRQAELFEREADEYVNEKKPNTFYPTISQKYSEGLKLILDASDCQELKTRLMLKLQDAQLDDARMMSAVGADLASTIKVNEIHQSIVNLNLDNFDEAFKALLSLPILPNQLIGEASDFREENQSFIAKLCSNHVKLSALGKPIGFKSGKSAKANELRMHQREVLIIMIKMIKDILDIYEGPLEEAIFEMLKYAESPFVPPARLMLFTEGLYLGFQNNFVGASHILVPQIENSLRHVARDMGISVTNYDQKEEFENTLGGCITKMVDITDKDLFTELKSFLIDSSDVNFRNELLHGNMNHMLIQHYGYYNWWLCLKMIFETGSYFKIKATL